MRHFIIAELSFFLLNVCVACLYDALCTTTGWLIAEDVNLTELDKQHCCSSLLLCPVCSSIKTNVLHTFDFIFKLLQQLPSGVRSGVGKRRQVRKEQAEMCKKKTKCHMVWCWWTRSTQQTWALQELDLQSWLCLIVSNGLLFRTASEQQGKQ